MSHLAGRPWHVAVGAFAAGLALSQAVPPLTLAAAAVLLACLACARAPGLAVVAAALLLAGSAIGAARLDALDHASTAIGDSRPISVRAHLLTRARPSAFGASAEARIAGGSLTGTRVLLRFDGRGGSALPGRAAIGDELSLAGSLRRPANDPDASFDFAAHLRRRGIAGELLVERVRLTGARRGGIAGALDGLRRRAETAVAAGLPEADAALALGMVLGEDEEIDSATRDDWRDAGLSHLLAVSGQNVMLLMALALPMLVAAGLGPRGRGLALLCLVALYVPLAGAGPSLQRAGVMGAAGIAAMTLSRPSSRWYALLLAAAVTLALDPRACGDPGWQLSFVAVAGILVAGRPLAARLRRIAEELVASAPRRADGRRAAPRRARWALRGHRHHGRGHVRHGAPGRVPLRIRAARRAGGQPAGAPGGRARHVARDGQGRARRRRAAAAGQRPARRAARAARRTCRSPTSTASPSAARPSPADASGCRCTRRPRWLRPTRP